MWPAGAPEPDPVQHLHFTIEPCTAVNQAGWLVLRRALWPEGSEADHRAEMAVYLARPDRFAPFVARDGAGVAIGLAEASLRSDYVNGTETSPVACLEGLYVLPAFRRRGLASALCREPLAP